MPENQLAIQEPPPLTLTGPLQPRGLALNSIGDMMEFCKIAVASRLLPKGIDTPEAAFIALNAGLEIGLTPSQSLQGIAVINGRPVLWGDHALAVATSHPDCENIEEYFEGEGENKTAVCAVSRRGRTQVTRKFAWKDAKRAGLTTKVGPWQQYPLRMLQLRARAFALRDCFSDALKGIGVREEVRDYAEPKQLQKVKLVLPDEKPAETAEAPTGEEEEEAVWN